MKRFDEILDKLHAFMADGEAKERGKLPSGCYFLDRDNVLCLPRTFGDARRPYSSDGLILWAYSSGAMKIEESTFNYNVDFDCGRDPKLAFWFGERDGRGDGFVPVSITGAGLNAREENISRYCVYTDDGAYYIAESRNFSSGLFVTVDNKKRTVFRLFLKNNTDRALDTYLSAYYDLILMHKSAEHFEMKWYRKCETADFGFISSSTEYLSRTSCLHHFAAIERRADKSAVRIYSTTSPSAFRGAQHLPLQSAISLSVGRIDDERQVTTFSESSVAADMSPLTLPGGGSVTFDYIITYSQDRGTLLSSLGGEFSDGSLDSGYFHDLPDVYFEGNALGVSDFALSSFMRYVFRQNEFCARAKNYAGPLIGVRDIFQQLESALLWIPEYCRGKIVEALGFIGDDGRCPRQYSYPGKPDILPEMDLREFIDQGVWVISTVHRYISFTGDYSILDEECPYYHFDDQTVKFSDRRDSVLSHLVAICDFLLSNLDEETGCLHALYGDWNDALDGLGKTTDPGRKFGTGVSVMATLQLYQNLGELSGILKATGRHPELIVKYRDAAEKIAAGIEKYAIEERDGEKKIIHGWGDKRSYEVGSFCDNDGESRDSATSNAFLVLSGMEREIPGMKKHILSAYRRLDSKYGIKTFEPYFRADNTGVGRIINLPAGTAENAATYIHATLFAVWSLFELGESDAAWEQIRKLLPPTHKEISTTPFVMPNSYIHNEELGLDGESMSDWFTGSGCVLIKVLFFCAFGIKADLDSLSVLPAETLPFRKMKTTLHIKGGEITVSYEKVAPDGKKNVSREFYVNSVKVPEVKLANSFVKGKSLLIEIKDV